MTNPNNPQLYQKDEIYCKFASETLLQLLTGFEDKINGIVKNKEDIEYVHKARVSSRRLRAVLPLFKFCLPKNEFKEWSNQIKKVTLLLAQARDIDVQIAVIEKYKKRLKNTIEKQAIDALLVDHKKTRNNIQPSVVNELETLKASNILEDIRRFCEQNISEASKSTLNPNRILGKAYWHISSKLDDFLSMEKYVYLENEKRNHHQMRIYAKKLRYTLEVFAQLYKNNLHKQIENIKAFQDVLGEMHDCDVWIDYLPEFIEKLKTKNSNGNSIKKEQALPNFIDYLKNCRAQYYRQFVDLWNRNKKSGFYVRFRKIIGCGWQMPKDKKQKMLEKSDVKIALLSDIHANLKALQRVFEDSEERGVDIYLNMGDSIGFGPCPNEVVELLCEKNVLSILGNYDLEVIEREVKAKGEKNIALKYARKELAKSCECYLFSLPRELRLEVANKKLLVTHGSPASIEEHIYQDTPIERLKILADIAKAEVILVGHSHEQFHREVDGACFVNPGSVGRPGDGNPQTAYSILSFNPFKVELIRLDYDVEGTADALRKKGLPESYSQMLLRGVSIDTIIEEDKNSENEMVQNPTEIIEVVDQISRKYWPDNEHYNQVSKIALELFDGLTKLHNLGMRERCWLECAAFLHDIGLSKARGGHHKKSAKLILNDTQLPFTSQERRIIASIARYHRKALPKQSHYNLKTLNRLNIQKIKMLSSLLRIADSLDYSHQSIVEAINIKVGTKRILVGCRSEMKSALEEQAFNKKKDLFEKVYAKKLVLVWKQP
jgi:putative phosphoesterase